MSSKQTTNLNDRFIGERGRLISDTAEVTNLLKVGGFLVMIDIEKTFHSLDYLFLMSDLKK